VDTHSDLNVTAALDHIGGLLGREEEFATDVGGASLAAALTEPMWASMFDAIPRTQSTSATSTTLAEGVTVGSSGPTVTRGRRLGWSATA